MVTDSARQKQRKRRRHKRKRRKEHGGVQIAALFTSLGVLLHANASTPTQHAGPTAAVFTSA
jgi:hypothetical protein